MIIASGTSKRPQDDVGHDLRPYVGLCARDVHASLGALVPLLAKVSEILIFLRRLDLVLVCHD